MVVQHTEMAKRLLWKELERYYFTVVHADRRKNKECNAELFLFRTLCVMATHDVFDDAHMRDPQKSHSSSSMQRDRRRSLGGHKCLPANLRAGVHY